ncbi:initiation factor 2 [Coniochaeta ligniaria NRRL 30616]|uniref:Translation initiation factor IF-2, mitochondrial n=1 Tax=Coniochaeta ligniaria NRRL 30616 TaxID=1408157 RepID=A0A1J7JFT6_9PEZI|nr:initiation factor 2 [Coniochaeta ligniaria NRRL 30616]
MLRGGLWQNQSRSSACTAWHRAFRLRQARRYTNGPGPNNTTPKPIIPGTSFGGGGWGGIKSIPGVAAPLIRKAEVAADGLLPHEREARQREREAREAEEARQRAVREAAEAKQRAEQEAREAKERAAKEAAEAFWAKAEAEAEARKREDPARQTPLRHRSEPKQQRFGDSGFIRRVAVPETPIDRLPQQLGGRYEGEEWGHMRRRERPAQQEGNFRRLDWRNAGADNKSKTPDSAWSQFESMLSKPDRAPPPQERSNPNLTQEEPINPNLIRRESAPPQSFDPPAQPSRRWTDRTPNRPKPKPRRYNAGEPQDDFDDESYQEQRRRRRAEKERRKREKELAAANAGPVPIFLPEYISVANLAEALGVKQAVFLAQLEELGFEDVSAESIMTGETAALVAQEYGFEPTVDSGETVDLKPRPPPEDPSSLPPRPPVVTIMGHVDHGKTTLLDYLRKSSVAASEHGGITQHIGAFSVKLSGGKQITFLDTPGHAAFLTMRQRGANVTDVVILVVAADDSVKPQTIEALKHARAAKVPIIVAINKVDKESARIDLVKSDLANNGVEIEDFGGDVQVVCVSGKTGQGMGDLEESILSLSEILDLRAEQDGMAEGWVLESSVKSIGRAATVLVKRGTLRKGDYLVAGKVFAKIRVLRSEAGVEIDEAPPGTPVEILGWRDLPDAGDQVLQAPDEDKARNAIEYRIELSERGEAVAQMAQQDVDKREKEREKADKAAAEEAEDEEDGEAKDETPGTTVVNFLVRGDVHGSVEAVCASIMEVGNNEVRPRILTSAVGSITESDVEYAALTGSAIINFNNPVPDHIKRLTDESGVKIMDHNVIYHLVDAIKDNLSEKLKPTVTTRVLGEAEVLQLFPINIKGRKFKNIAGCRIRNGQITRNAKYRVLRKGVKVFEGTLDSLKHGKKDVSEMRKGAECGISFEDWDELQEGDQIQAFEEISEKRHL